MEGRQHQPQLLLQHQHGTDRGSGAGHGREKKYKPDAWCFDPNTGNISNKIGDCNSQKSIDACCLENDHRGHNYIRDLMRIL